MKNPVSRRSFLKQAAFAAGAVAAPIFLPSSVLGRNGLIAPSERINIAFIGLGNQGLANLCNPSNEVYNITGGLIGKSGVKVVAVCDVDSGRRERSKGIVNNLYGNRDCAAYNDFREVLARKDVDAIVNATPDHWHAYISIAAARLGKAVYSEKPLAHDIPEGRAICDAANLYGTVWQTGSQQRSWAGFRRACELVRNGRIGEVKTVRVALPVGGRGNHPIRPTAPPPELDYEMWLGPAPWAPYTEGRCHGSFRNISDYSSGPIADWAGHHLDCALWGMDADRSWPVSVEAEGIFNTEGLYDNMIKYRIECKYARGFTLIIEDSSRRPQGKDGITFTRCYAGKNIGVLFEGTKGWIQVNRGGMNCFPESIRDSIIGPDEIHLYRSNDHHQNFLDCIRQKKLTAAQPEFGHHSVGAAYLGIIAMKLKRPLHWDGDKELFINDEEANRMLTRTARSPWRI